MKRIAPILAMVMAFFVIGCHLRPRPTMPEIRNELDKELKLEQSSSGCGVGGSRGGDKIQSDNEESLWVIPKGADSDAIYEQLKKLIVRELGHKGAEVVSSGQGASSGYVKEYLHLGGHLSSYTFVYKYHGGLGFINVFLAQYNAEEESGRLGINHIFIPYP